MLIFLHCVSMALTNFEIVNEQDLQTCINSPQKTKSGRQCWEKEFPISPASVMKVRQLVDQKITVELED